jgi:hypothetical protein
MVWWLGSDLVEVTYGQFVGLQVRLGGAPIVQGSGFQYFDAKSGKGLFSSRWRPLQVEGLPDGSLRVRFMDLEGDVAGTHLVERRHDGFTVKYVFRWRGRGVARIENTLGLIWSSSLSEGVLSADGGPDLPIIPFGGSQNGLRPVATARRSLTLRSPAWEASLSLQGASAALSDARGSNLEWARGRGLFALVSRPLTLSSGEEAEISVEWRLTPRPAPPTVAPPQSGSLRELPGAYSADPRPLPLVPKPKVWKPSGGSVSAESPDFSGAPEGWADRVRAAMGRLWLPGRSRGAPVRASVTDLGLPPEGYEIRISAGGVEARGQDQAGLRHAAYRLAQLARPSGSRLVWPCGVLRDHPTVAWRGVHLFVGPESPEFQSRLIERVLAPLGFNRSVLQCERTAWKSLGLAPDSQTMAVEDLARLFDIHREAGIEPVPLIQSLGHMGWFFQSGRNLDLAVNPQLPFTLDARRKRARETIAAVWREAVSVLRPATVHFGLDEVNRRGMANDPRAATRLWSVQLPHLLGLAKELQVRPMMWGDFMLAPGEAPDATNGANLAEAQERRAFLRTAPGSIVADWHYVDDPRPETYRSLALWRSLGAFPVAASWYRPDNVRGHTLAAVAAGAGTLQTTWAGTLSDELSMLRHFEQFAAMVLAADYAWSGRSERPDQLGYRPQDVLRRLYFSPPQAVAHRSGRSWTDGTAADWDRIGPVAFHRITPLPLHTVLTEEGRSAPAERVWQIGSPAQAVALALDCSAWMKEGDPVAEVELSLEDGSVVRQQVRYGLHVRCPDDSRAVLAAPSARRVSAVIVPLLSAEAVVKALRVRASDHMAGVRVRGLTVL